MQELFVGGRVKDATVGRARVVDDVLVRDLACRGFRLLQNRGLGLHNIWKGTGQPTEKELSKADERTILRAVKEKEEERCDLCGRHLPI